MRDSGRQTPLTANDTTGWPLVRRQMADLDRTGAFKKTAVFLHPHPKKVNNRTTRDLPFFQATTRTTDWQNEIDCMSRRHLHGLMASWPLEFGQRNFGGPYDRQAFAAFPARRHPNSAYLKNGTGGRGMPWGWFFGFCLKPEKEYLFSNWWTSFTFFKGKPRGSRGHFRSQS